MSALSRAAMIAAVSLLIPLISANASAQESPLQIQAVTADAWPSVEVTATVLDGGGQPVQGLAPADFTATLNNTPAPVSNVRTTSDPGLGIGVVLAFDVSGSMAGPPLEQAKLAGSTLISQLGTDDQAAVVSFGSLVTVVQPFTTDRQALEAAISNLSIAGDTALYGGVEASAQLARESGLERRAIILLSDGFDFGGLGVVTREESIALARDSGAMVFAVGLGTEIDVAFLQELATAGRGRYLEAPAPEDLSGAYSAAGDVLRQQYVISLDASGVTVESEDVSVTLNAVVNGATVSASASFLAPASALAPEPAPEPEPEPVDEPVAEPVPEPAPETASEDTGSSSALTLVAFAAAGAALVLGGGAVAVTRRRRGAARETRALASDAAAERLGKFQADPISASAPEVQTAPAVNGATAWIEWEPGERRQVGDRPVTIGSTGDCDIRIDATGDRLARLRIWRRDRVFMVHNLSAASTVTINGRSISWAVLEDGDEIEVGDTTLRFRDAGERT